MARLGLASTASRTALSSRSNTGTPRAAAKVASRVDFPTERGPCSAMTGSSVANASRMGERRRAVMGCNGPSMKRSYHNPMRRN